jgi:hypothetical protein
MDLEFSKATSKAKSSKRLFQLKIPCLDNLSIKDLGKGNFPYFNLFSEAAKDVLQSERKRQVPEHRTLNT